MAVSVVVLMVIPYRGQYKGPGEDVLIDSKSFPAWNAREIEYPV
jgi:hypothetical protein